MGINMELISSQINKSFTIIWMIQDFYRYPRFGTFEFEAESLLTVDVSMQTENSYFVLFLQYKALLQHSL